MVNILQLKLQSGITLAILTLQPLFSYKTCNVWWLRCGENLNKIGQELQKLQSKTFKKMIMEWRNHGITDRLKTVYPPRTMFCGGYKNSWTPLHCMKGMFIVHHLFTLYCIWMAIIWAALWKNGFLHMRKQRRRSKLISAFVFPT